MRTASAFRIGAHVCLYLAAVSMSVLFLGALYLPFVTAAMILAADLIAVNIDKTAARYAVASAPAVVLIFAKSIPSAAALAVPIAYSAAVVGAGRFSREIWQVRKEAKLLLILVIPILAVSLLGGYSTLFAEEYPLAPIYCSWAMLFITVIFVFLMLRSARMGNVRSAEWNKYNLLWFFIPLAAAIPLGAFGLYAFVPLMKILIIVLCTPLIALMYVGNIVLQIIFNKDFLTLEDDSDYPMPTFENEFEPNVQKPVDGEKINAFFQKMTRVEIPKEIVLAIGLTVLALLLVLITVLVIRRGRRVRGEFAAEDIMEDSGEETKRGRRQRRGARAARSSAERVRFTYRQYLAFLRIHGIVPSKSNTSLDISREADHLLRETDELLRGLYIKARYGRESEVTEAEAELAAETYLRLVNDKNIKDAAERK